MVGYVVRESVTPGAAENAAPCFTKVDGSDIALSDLTVSGYLPQNEDEEEGCEEGLKITMLAANGGQKKTAEGKVYDYVWIDLPYWDLPAGWYDGSSNPLDGESSYLEGDEGDATKITFAPGVGFRVTEHSSYSGLSLTFAGGVKMTQTSLTDLVPGAATASGNPTPRTIKLSEITVSGYLPQNEDEEEGCEEGLKITMLAGNGGQKKTDAGKPYDYVWIDLPYWDLPAGWYDGSSNPLDGESSYLEGDEGDATKITFAPGDGFRVTEHSSYSGLQLNFPAPLD